jgi:hypothetical protein
MADVSLDDLIKKDREKGKLDRLKNVPLASLRNSKPKNLSKEANPPIIKTGVIGDPKTLLPTSTDQSKSVSRILVMIVETTGRDMTCEINELNVPDLKPRGKRREKRSSAH